MEPLEPLEPHATELPASAATPVKRGWGHGVRSTMVAAGAAFGLTLAGLGIAAAQTGDAQSAANAGAAASETQGQATDDAPPSEGATPTPAPPAAGEEAPALADGDAAGRPGRGHGRHHFRANLAVAAETIGVTEEELKTAIKDGQTIAAVAQSKNVDPQTVIDALVADGKERLAQAVEDGDLTQAQADERAARLPEHMTRFVNETRPPRGPGGPGHEGRHVRPSMAVVASTIGVSEEELKTALRDGETTIAAYAQSKGVEPQKVIDALVADGKAQLAAAVEAGEITQEQADARAESLPERMAAFVNHAFDGHGPRGHRGPGGPGGPRPADAPAEAEGSSTATATA